MPDDPPFLLPIQHPTVARHTRAAMTALRIRAGQPPLDPDSYDLATGHLRKVQKLTGLTPPQICDVLHITGYRRRRIAPNSGYGLRFRYTKKQAVASRLLIGYSRPDIITDEMCDTRPHKRPKRFKLTRP